MLIICLYVVIIILIILLLITLNEIKKNDNTISNFKEGAKKSKSTYCSMWGKLRRRNGKIERLEKQIKHVGLNPVR